MTRNAIRGKNSGVARGAPRCGESIIMQERDGRATRRKVLAAAAGGLTVVVGNTAFERTADAQAAAATTTTYVSFQAIVNAQTILKLVSTVAQIQTPEIYLLISTQGGEVMAGITAYNFLKALPSKLTTHNIGNIDSIGNAIFLAGEQRFASAHSTFMFHGVGRQVAQNTALDTKTLKEFLEGNQADEKRIGDIIKERTKLSSDQITQFFRESKTVDAPAAFEAGIIHQMVELKFPTGTQIMFIPT
jgi:ATP-dependent Clp protease, protease subunit